MNLASLHSQYLGYMFSTSGTSGLVWTAISFSAALVLVVWFMGWIKAMRRPLQAGWGAAQAATAVVGLAHPPSAPLFDGQNVAQISRTGPVFGLYMHLKPPPAPLLVTPVCCEQQVVATFCTGPDMALHRRVFSKRKCGPEGVAGSPSTAVWRALRPYPLASG